MAWRSNAEDSGPRAPVPDSPCRPAATQATRGVAGHSGRENGQGRLSPRRHSKAPCAKTVGPTLPLASVLTSARPSAHHTASRLGLPAPGGLILTLGRPQRGSSQGAWRHNADDWGLPSPSAGLTFLPRGHLGRSGRMRSFKVGERAGPSEPTATVVSPLLDNAWAHAPARCALTSALPSARGTPAKSGLPASWGLTLNLGRPPSIPSQGAWRRNARNWGSLSLSTGLTLPPSTTRAARGATSHSGQENGQGPLSPWRHSKAPSTKTLGPRPPLTNALTSARPYACRTPGGSGLAASWGLTLTPGRPRGAPPKGPGAETPGIGDPRAPAPDSPSRLAATRASRVESGHSGWENWQAPPSHRQHS